MGDWEKILSEIRDLLEHEDWMRWWINFNYIVLRFGNSSLIAGLFSQHPECRDTSHHT